MWIESHTGQSSQKGSMRRPLTERSPRTGPEANVAWLRLQQRSHLGRSLAQEHHRTLAAWGRSVYGAAWVTASLSPQERQRAKCEWHLSVSCLSIWHITFWYRRDDVSQRYSGLSLPAIPDPIPVPYQLSLPPMPCFPFPAPSSQLPAHPSENTSGSSGQ